MATFQIGDKVQWTSQSGGYTKTKRGVVVGIVRPLESPGFAAEAEGLILRSIPGFSRGHESYLIRVGNQKSVYWPRVVQLEEDRDGTGSDGA